MVEVYQRCTDAGFPAPSERAIYYLLNTPDVQATLNKRREDEQNNRIARLTERTAARQRLMDAIEGTIAARAEAYRERNPVPGAEHGLVYLADKKSVVVRRTLEQTDYEVYDIWRTDNALISELRALLNDQDASDDRLIRNLRGREAHAARMEEYALNRELALRELEAWDAESPPTPTNDDKRSEGEGGTDTGTPPFNIEYTEQDRA